MLEARCVEIVSHQYIKGIEAEKVADKMDEVTLDVERRLSVDTLCRRAGLLRQIEEALGRIENGSYGTCLSCGGSIAVKRLTALPWAELCINCQEAIEDRRPAGPIAEIEQTAGGRSREDYGLSRNSMLRSPGLGQGEKPSVRL